MAFGFYHLACMLLIIYKTSAKFAVRGIHASLRESDVSLHYLKRFQGLTSTRYKLCCTHVLSVERVRARSPRYLR